jgi:catecholate siderophore receptor
MTKNNRGISRPASLRRNGAIAAIGMGAVFLSSPVLAQETKPQDEVELDTVRIEDRTADVNPYTSEGAPYKAKVSGDARRVKPLAETPATITVITETQIEESGRNDLRAILDAQPGITLGTGEGGNRFGDRYIIRGQEARSDVFVDGLRDPGMQSRESFAVEQVEITKGPSATFAGRGAAGGAVNTITKQARTDYNFHNIDLTGGSDHHFRGTLDSNFRLSDQFAVRANLMYLREDVPHRGKADRERYGGALAAAWQISDAVSLLADYYHLNVDDRPDSGGIIATVDQGGKPYKIPAYVQNADFAKAEVNTGTVRLKIAPWDGFRIENTVRYGRVDYDYGVSELSRGIRGATDPVNPGGAGYWLNSKASWQRTEYLADQLNVIGSFETGALKHNLVVGVEYSHNAVDTNSAGYTAVNAGATNCRIGTTARYCIDDGFGNGIANVSNLTQRSYTRNPNPNFEWQVDTISGYAMDSIDIGKWATVAGGVRFDSYDFHLLAANTPYNYSDTIWSYNASLTLKPTDDGIVYFAWATGADINGGESDVGTSCGYGGLCTAVDPATGQVVYNGKPERSDNFELGTKWNLFGDKLLLTAAAFQTTKKDLIEGGLDSYVANGGALNGGKNRVRGIELGLAGNITSRLSGQIGGTLMKSKVLESSDSNFTAAQRALGATNVGKRLANFANRSVDAQLRYQLTDAIAFGGNVNYQSAMYGGQPDTAAAINTTMLNNNTVAGPYFGQYSVRVPGHTTFDAFVTYKVNDRFSVRVNGQNLGDKIYYVAGYRSGKFAYYGEGRTVRVTLSGKF